MNALVTIPNANVTIRAATAADVAFIDALQKLHSDRVGFMRTDWIEDRIRRNEVIVAEDSSTGSGPVGYCMGVDRYKYRDDVGIIYQLNVVPGRQRGFIGMTLLRAMFDRAAYGCRLYSCWCAQDIEANRFWEAMGFVPLAYRGGSERKKRVHIFWQKRIREGDVTTPWWFPSETTGGQMGAARLVLPIPPGKHWSDDMPVLLPRDSSERQLPAPRKSRGPRQGETKPPAKNGPLTTAMIGMRFAPAAPAASAAPEEKPKREKKPRQKNDPKLVAAARELRDRWLEHVNSGATLIESSGKYDVTRALPNQSAIRDPQSAIALLPAA